MKLTPEQEKMLLIALVAALALLMVYRFMAGEKPKTAPLTYTRGAVASSPVRHGLASRAAGADPLSVFIERREEKFPGVARDIFRMENPTPKPKLKSAPVPPAPVKTPEELAAEAARAAAEQAAAAVRAAAEQAAAAVRAAEEAARADMTKIRFLGYLTDRESKLFLSKDGELFIVKSGDTVLKSYKVKEASKDYVILHDTVTRVDVRVELSGGEQPVLPRSH